jgi:hypothetical protein
MQNKKRKIISLVCSFLIFAVGTFRIITESLSSTPLLVAYTLAIGGLIGVIGSVNELLRKPQSN